jgi:hypothetical protein
VTVFRFPIMPIGSSPIEWLYVPTKHSTKYCVNLLII